MAFSTKQLMYLLTRVKRGVRPRLARAVAAVPSMGKRGAVRRGAVDLAFSKPYGFLTENYPVPHGITKIVDAKRNPVGSVNWQVYDEGKHLHIANVTGSDYGLGRWNLGAANVRRLLNQFKGYTGGTINRVTGYRISGVRGQVPKDTTVAIPRKVGGPPVTLETPAGTHPTFSTPPVRRRRR